MTFDEFIAGGVDLMFGGVVGPDGYLNGGSADAPAAGNTNGSAMLRFKGAVSADPTVQESDPVDVPGDNGSQGSFDFGPEGSPRFTIEKSVFSLLRDALVQRTKTFTEGNVKMGVLQPSSYNPEDFCWILQSPVKKKDAGLDGRQAWHGYIIPLSTVTPLGRDQFRTRTVATDRMRVSCNPVTMLFDGLEVDDTNFGTDGAPIIPFDSDYPLLYQRWTGDGAEDTYITDVAAVSTAELIVKVDGVLQVLTTDYTYNTSTREIVFAVGSVPAAAAVITARIGFRK
jgi:hypothetical protein